MVMPLHFYIGTVSQGVFTVKADFEAYISIRESPADDGILQLNEDFLFNFDGDDYAAKYGGVVPGGVYFSIAGSSHYVGLTAPVSLETTLPISSVDFDLENMVPVPCFLTGSLIETSRGAVAVEELAEGDLLRTLSGEMKPLRWIGHRKVSARLAAANPGKSLPVRFAAGCLGANLPARDLWLSPDHCLYHDGALVQAKTLINGTTVTQQDPGRSIVYYHLLLDKHEVVFAEGAASETYRPCNNIFGFTNAEAFPAGVERNQHRRTGCFPVEKSGAKVEALKAVLAMQAEVLDCIAQQAAA